MKLRLILDPPAAGAWNMAVDEMMLETVAASGQPILRFYSWSEPTLSLGYFQALEDRRSHVASLDCPIVRRSTGGGAILHDREITYSIAVPLADRWSASAAALYNTFHEGLVRALGSFGIEATLCAATLRQLPEPFLCFERRAQGDVLVGAHKIAGSAQRRRRGALVQHGSVILSQSSVAPEIAGIVEVSGQPCDANELIERWGAELNRAFCVTFVKGGWLASEAKHAQTLQSTRFDSPAWVGRRSAM